MYDRSWDYGTHRVRIYWTGDRYVKLVYGPGGLLYRSEFGHDAGGR